MAADHVVRRPALILLLLLLVVRRLTRIVQSSLTSRAFGPSSCPTIRKASFLDRNSHIATYETSAMSMNCCRTALPAVQLVLQDSALTTGFCVGGLGHDSPLRSSPARRAALKMTASDVASAILLAD